MTDPAQKKLGKILKLRQLKEQESAGALARCRQARQSAEDKAHEIHGITTQYRLAHLQHSSFEPFMLRQFRDFYAQLNKAEQAQAGEVARAAEAEAVVMNHYVAHYADRKALEGLLEQRETTHKIEEKRRLRRSEPGARANPWTMVV